GQVAVEVELARARLAAAGGVGDLDVRHLAGVGRDGAVDVVAVGGEVEDVEQDAHVAGARGPGPVHHRGRVGGAAQRVGLGAAHRLDEDGGADAGGGPRRVHDAR